MTSARLCVVFNNVDEASSIGKLCKWACLSALEAGWRVSVVARDLDQSLVPDVEWLPLTVPPRLHAVQWYAAYAMTRRAMAGRKWDVVHVQQPQLAGLADVLHLHYLVRAARASRPNAENLGLRERVGAAQARLTEIGEDRQFQRLDDRLEVVFVSDLLQRWFQRLYGPPPRHTVLHNPAPSTDAVASEERATARRSFGLAAEDFVIGFLGGSDPRKGGAALVRALPQSGVTLLAGGSGSEALAEAGTPVRALGFVSDTRSFFAACDAFAAVSTFDPAPLAPLEALSHGVPVIGTDGVGGVAEMAAAGCAMTWAPGRDLTGVLDRVRTGAEGLRHAATSFAAQRSQAVQRQQLIDIYAGVLARKQVTRREP